MTWVAWRVRRPQLLAAIGAVVILAIWLSATGLTMGHDQTWKYWTDGDVYVLYALPGVLGLVLGASLLAGEMDHCTHRLAWTQSVTRTRWLAFKLLVAGIVAAGMVTALTVLLEWWTGAVSLAASTDSGGFSGIRIQPSGFDLTGSSLSATPCSLSCWAQRSERSSAIQDGRSLLEFRSSCSVGSWCRSGSDPTSWRRQPTRPSQEFYRRRSRTVGS